MVVTEVVDGIFTLASPSKTFEARAKWADGVVHLRSLTVHADNVTGQVLGEVPVAAIRAAITEYLRRVEGDPFPLIGLDTPIEVGGSERRRRLDDEFLRGVAVAYLRTLVDAPRRPVEQLAEDLEEPRQKVASWISRARREGWLSAAVVGRAGAQPGPRLVEWIEASRE